MKEFYCVSLRFKDKRISDNIFHAHLFTHDEAMYFQIFDDDEQSQIDHYFSISDNALGLFHENFEIVASEVAVKLDNSRIYKIISFQKDKLTQYFTIFISKICLIRKNDSQDNVDNGTAFLNRNGLKVVNLFYSFFANYSDKNSYTISRMNGMDDFYKIPGMSYRPELEYKSNEHRGSEQFTIKKIPTIFFRADTITFEEIKTRLLVISNLLSFCFGVRVLIEKIVFRTQKEVYIYKDTEPNSKTYVSDLTSIFHLLENNYSIEKILKTDWFNNYMKKEKHLNMAIDNFLHSREVSLGASYLLLFSVIEIFNTQRKPEKFKFILKTADLHEQLFNAVKPFLMNKADEEEFAKKFKTVVDKLEYKPFRSPLEETLIINNISSSRFGYSFSELKKTRDGISHGSINSIKEEKLKSQIYSIRKIAASLILSQLGLKSDFKIR